ncbi:MAG TPA: protein kinase [Polyangiaceae bacterium]|nr:protein kinase [Polyangiaceae bacterium]
MADVALAMTQAMPVSIGSILAGRYEILSLLGEGGMGAVFRAHDRELDDDVALKILHASVASDAAALTRFRREVKLARRVTHRNVARTFDLGTHEELRFLTMELIAGESVAQAARRARLALPEVLRVAAEIARGLAAAHVAGVVHRDLKPDNVMLADDRVVLTDFGIARVADGGAEVLRTGMIVGTPAYMAPEQLENLAVDGRTDVYALGTMLFELLAGRLPFTGDTPLSIAAQRMTANAPDLRAVASSVPEGIAALVGEMLARRREDRPDAQAVLDRVESLRGNAAPLKVVSKLPTLTSETLAGLGQPRAVAIETLVSGGAETAELAPMLTSAIADALTESRVVASLAKDGSQADLVVQGTVRASGDRVRARLRVVGRKGNVVWAGHVDGAMSASFDFEDEVAAIVTDVIRARTSADPGPHDPALRPAYDEAMAEFNAFALPHVRNAVAILEAVEAKQPGDPRIRTLLARALWSVWGQLGGRDRSIVARAEELALRALEVDPNIGAAHHVISQIRVSDGELAAAVRADEEALRCDPRDANAHAAIGWMLAEALYVTEGLRRLDLAARLDPANPAVVFARANVLALAGQKEKARAVIDELIARSGPLAAVVILSRVAVWWKDAELAARTAEAIENAKAGAAWDPAARFMRSIVTGDIDPGADAIVAKLTEKAVAPRRRAIMHEVGADYYALMGAPEKALEQIEKLAQLPSTNLLWLDACPALASVRGDPRFAEARAMIAARVAQLWGSVGTWATAKP